MVRSLEEIQADKTTGNPKESYTINNRSPEIIMFSLIYKIYKIFSSI